MRHGPDNAKRCGWDVCTRTNYPQVSFSLVDFLFCRVEITRLLQLTCIGSFPTRKKVTVLPRVLFGCKEVSQRSSCGVRSKRKRRGPV